MNKFAKFFTIALCAISITSCSTKQGTGALMGTVAGGLLGAQFGKGEGKVLAAGAGALLGAFAGGAIGKSMDEQDKKIAEATSQRAFEQAPSGKKSEWKNPDNGHSGFVTPTKTYQSEAGRYCREYTQEVHIGDKIQKAYGTACRQPDGNWEIVRNN